MNLKLIVKDKSVLHFFSENLIGFRQDERQQLRPDENIYYLMKDEIFLNKNCGIDVGGLITFEIKDQSRMSNRELKNIYQYVVNEYDDVSVRLELVFFKIIVV